MDEDNRLIVFPGGQGGQAGEEGGQGDTAAPGQGQSGRMLLFGLDLGKFDAERSMDELAALAEAAGYQVAGSLIQRRASATAATALGAGQLERVRVMGLAREAEGFVFDGELTGSQLRNLEERLEKPVTDRTMLILSIFKNRAVTREGKLQVELAEQEYRLPRLAGLGSSLSRQGGGGGGGAGARRGGGESRLEYDRRYVRQRIATLKRKLREVAARREETQRSRAKSGVPVVALVGYTNVGKSSLLNALTGSTVPAEDVLFATLDPTARQLKLPDGQRIILMDTVGFVSRLPHSLVEAFKSTLEAARHADLLVRVCDASDEEAAEQLRVTEEVLGELGAAAPRLTVYNKCDLVAEFAPPEAFAMAVSAHTGQGLGELLAGLARALSGRVRHLKLLLPYGKLALAEVLRSHGSVDVEEYRGEGVYFEASLEAAKAHLFADYLVHPGPEQAPEEAPAPEPK